jgi:hypothetical protein
MNRRQWIGSLVATAIATACAPFGFGSSGLTLYQIYRLDKHGCNPSRVRMQDLRNGDLFLTCDPETEKVSPIYQAFSDPFKADPPVGHNEQFVWAITCGLPERM